MSRIITACSVLLLAAPVASQSASSPAWAIQLLGADAAASGAFVCDAGRRAPDRWSASCFQPALEPLIRIERGTAPGPEFNAQVCRAAESRGVRVPNGAMEVSASGTLAVGADLPDSVTVYRLLYVPYATAASLGVPEAAPAPGAPWIHHAGTCQAHVMWSERVALGEP